MPPYGPPPGRPPLITPTAPTTIYIIDCMFHYAYIWPKVGEPFWFYPETLQSHVVTGYFWTGFSWIHVRFDPDYIRALACYPVPTPY